MTEQSKGFAKKDTFTAVPMGSRLPHQGCTLPERSNTPAEA
jgi:hypothetical protein